MIKNMVKLLILLVLVTSFACKQKEKNKLAKKRLLEEQNSNPYAAVIKPLNIDSSKFDTDMKEFEKAFLMPYSYIANKIGAHRSKTEVSLSYAKLKKTPIKKLDKSKPEKDNGASDKKLPPIVKNALTLTEKSYIEHTKGENFFYKTTNNMGYGKEIKWINQILFVKSDGEKYSHRKSIENEHLKYKEEKTQILKDFIKLNNYMVSVSFDKNSSYENRDIKIYKIKISEKPYKKYKLSDIPKDFKMLSASGEIYIDTKTYVPLKIDIVIKSKFDSRKYRNKEGKPLKMTKEVKFSRKIYDIGKDIQVEPTKESYNRMIPPSEADAEEKILSFKKGHSAIDKLKKKDAKYKKLIGKTK